MKTTIPGWLTPLALSIFSPELGFAQGAAFTYQGRLVHDPAAATGRYDLRFSLFDAATSGNLVGSAVVCPDVLVSNGLFTVTLDFSPGVFDGRPLWLQIGVRTNEARLFRALTPRRALTPATYAQYAPSADTAAVSTAVSALAIITDAVGGRAAPQVDPAHIRGPQVTEADVFADHGPVVGVAPPVHPADKGACRSLKNSRNAAS